MQWQYQALCHVCRLEAYAELAHEECAQLTWLDGVFAVARYGSSLDELVWEGKYGFCADIFEWGGELMAKKAVEWVMLPKVVVTAVPMARHRLWWRGFNNGEVLARSFAKYGGLRYANLLKRVGGYRGAQLRRGRQQRVAAALQSMAVATGDLPRRVLVVDDVCTTGATLEACARALKSAGVGEVYGVVLALH